MAQALAAVCSGPGDGALLVVLFALYARYNRRAQEFEMDADEVGRQTLGLGPCQGPEKPVRSD